ncbi:hypothetical protein MA16_Dca007138 [Dendrobium catenatum]|uniref:Uncharacterized protein n=1 Tax=Dendrobium catenatum TaxID=906689 RepID=A0A2I0W3Y8_9ASPA|nr:hypothetical protein MA16_Dca007138 [Dendrobium catenatum]
MWPAGFNGRRQGEVDGWAAVDGWGKTLNRGRRSAVSPAINMSVASVDVLITKCKESIPEVQGPRFHYRSVLMEDRHSSGRLAKYTPVVIDEEKRLGGLSGTVTLQENQLLPADYIRWFVRTKLDRPGRSMCAVNKLRLVYGAYWTSETAGGQDAVNCANNFRRPNKRRHDRNDSLYCHFRRIADAKSTGNL